MASQVRNLLVRGDPDDILVMPGLCGVKEIQVHEEKYKVLDRHDRVVMVVEPLQCKRVNMNQLELNFILKQMK